LDHIVIGCNQDGIWGTADDKKLFVDCRQKYRHSGTTPYANWFYSLYESIFPDYPYRLGEPGFDCFQNTGPDEEDTFDPNRSPAGNPDQDYRIIVECISISPGLRVQHKDYPQFTIDQPGQYFNHSYIHKIRGEPHIHLSYQATSDDRLLWATYRIYDQLEDQDSYQPSELFTIVFNTQPLAGDLVIDGQVSAKDLAELSYYWLSQNASPSSDYYERADANRDGAVDFGDFTILASNWLRSLSRMEQISSNSIIDDVP
jgi:hypothetical protein